jgi:hypothetical protein
MEIRAMAIRCHCVFICCLLMAGCGNERLVRVTGVALRAGKPMPNLVINFSPEKGLRSFALTDASGKFKMIFNDGRDGVLVGNHKVWIALPTAGGREDPERQQRIAAQQSDVEIAQILAKYGSAEVTPLTFDLRADQEITLNLD